MSEEPSAQPNRIRATLAALAALALSSCLSSPPMPISTTTHALEKDVLLIHVALAAPLSPEQYVEAAARELERRGSFTENPYYYDVPLYELHFRFKQGNVLLASVLYRRVNDEAGGAPPSFEHERTYVYRHSGSGNDR